MDALVENERLSTLVKHQKIPTKNFEDLPDEVLLKICAYLSLKNIVCCSLVSKRARRVCHDESLWQKMNLYGKEVPSEFIKQTLANGCTYLSLQEAQIKSLPGLPSSIYHCGVQTRQKQNREHMAALCNQLHGEDNNRCILI